MFCFVVAIVVSWCMYVSWCTYVCNIWEVPLYRHSCLLVQPFPLQLDKSDNNNNLLYKAEKPSVRPSAFFPRQAVNSAVSASIDFRLA